MPSTSIINSYRLLPDHLPEMCIVYAGGLLEREPRLGGHPPIRIGERNGRLGTINNSTYCSECPLVQCATFVPLHWTGTNATGQVGYRGRSANR
jgi:hypothetical protein